MLPALVLGASAALAGASAIPSWETYATGFNAAVPVLSAGGHADCIQGNIPVAASAMNTHLNYTGPANQRAATETIVEFLQVNATLPMEVLGDKVNVSGTYNINAKLCFPFGSAPNTSSVQFLTHGVGFDKSYWDVFSADYSYQDAAALKGYTTFAYDRLGVGLSDHPDPIQVVQAPLEISIAHSLIQMLRSGSIASTSFSKVVGVGHSLGSELTNAITAQYPKDVDGAVLTGFSVDTSGQSTFFAGLDLVIASQFVATRFPGLAPGYLIAESRAGNQFGFFRAPGFAPALLDTAEGTKQTFTIGELFTNSMLMSSAPGFTGPIDVVDGQYDLPFCQSNCLVPENKAAAVKGALYPNAASGSTYYIAGDAGHGVNLHYSAGAAYAHIFEFIENNDLA
ncbi:hypothetical protein LSUE1_G001650 [Lachnellula suecica]|uniref:AB hydrolase-1 domain-containing protein n=1 Tax=Lachnellula suecica TaxID=602035 RepID=A0A8T9CN96_9HELO|nr:hypothetical protein LSUE1_G001650 [Lachnellula suecica]